MTDNIQHIDVDSDEFIDAPKALRDHVKKLQKAVQQKDERLGDLQGKLTASALTDVLGGFKNPERVKNDLLSDKVDPLDSEAVSKWLESNGDDYARGDATPAPSQTTDSENSEEAAAHERLQSTGDLRSPADMSKLEAALAELPKDATGDQVIEVYRKHGV